jgi:acetolactate synthase-1/2/3 large subunit
MKFADYLANYLYKKKLKNIFSITGAGSMHFNDSIGSHPGLNVIYTHHEQAAAMAAEGEARISRLPGVVNVSTGPGGTNTLTGVTGAWVDSIPMLVISGQVMKKDIGTNIGYRQLGVQEANVVDMARPVTKFCKTIMNPYDIEIIFDEAIKISLAGKPGPVWVEIPLDVQSFNLDIKKIKKTKKNKALNKKTNRISQNLKDRILNLISKSKKPIIISGYGIRSAKAEKDLEQFVNLTKIPLTTSWNTIDLINSSSENVIGRSGVFGDRASNYAVQKCDLLIVLGSRMSTAQVGYMDDMFSVKSKKIYVDISKKELNKPTFKADIKIQEDVKIFLKSINIELKKKHIKNNTFKKWREKILFLKNKYEIVKEHQKREKGFINSFRFINELSKKLKANDIVVTDMGTSFTCTMQSFKAKDNQRIFTSSGLASMGYGLPAAIGACVGSKKNRVICLTGDGGLMFNVQELQTVIHYNLPIKIFVIDNDGYLTQKLMQIKNFKRYVGAHPKSGVSCPDFVKIGKAFNFETSFINSDTLQKKLLNKILKNNKPHLCVVKMNPMQPLHPRVVMKMNKDGSFNRVGLESVFPFLENEEHKSNLKMLEDI